MNIQFFDSYPFRPLSPDLRSLFGSADRVDAAVAFVTKAGVSLLRQYLKGNPARSARLVASVRFPTALEDLADLAHEFPGTVWLHLGFQIPEEPDADRGQFHSKLVLIERGATERTIIVGSHNWTQFGLDGVNLEAGVVIHCQESDSIVSQARQHIDACAAPPNTEPFDRARLRFYQAVQRDLHVGVGPGRQESENFPGFERLEALVIHTEDGTPSGLPVPVQLFVPVRSTARAFLNVGRHVLLYVYPPGTLHGLPCPGSTPEEFVGQVTMRNELDDAPVDVRQVNCLLDNLDKPVITLLPSGTVPTASGELSQVVIRFEPTSWRGDLPIFHTGDRPKLSLGVEYDTIDRSTALDKLQRSPLIDEEPTDASDQSFPTYSAPQRLIAAAALKIPSRDLYRHEIKPMLHFVLEESELVKRDIHPELTLESPPRKTIHNRFIYNVSYRLSKEWMARIARKVKLFNTK